MGVNERVSSVAARELSLGREFFKTDAKNPPALA
jgi:hypothetical protein